MELIKVRIDNGVKGDKGDIGLKGEPGSSTINYNAGNVLGIGGFRLVYLDSNNNLQYSSNDDLQSINKLAGITLNAAIYLGQCEVKSEGKISDISFNFTIDQPIYLGINGLFTQTYPISPALACKVIGYATAVDTMYVKIQPTILIG